MRSCVTSSTFLLLIRNEASTSPVWLDGTLHTVSRILCVPIYSGSSLKNFLVMQLSINFAACSFVDSRTSQVAKLLLQKYCVGMLAVCRSSSKTSFVKPTSLLVLRSMTLNERILVSRRSVIPRMDEMMLSLK